MSETVKNKGGRPAVNATPVTVRIPPELLRALDRARERDAEDLTRPEAVRRALADWLRERDYLKE
ncbi:MAG: ribbon-helix-helix protein, CopG family [Rhodobacteraceae bacterium]|nr:ribbon-helix-helix protein, CopG family [Paracoccaceae bacterium]